MQLPCLRARAARIRESPRVAGMEAIVLCGVQGSGKTTLYRDRFLATHVRVSMDLLRTRHREAAFLRAVPRDAPAVRGRQHEPDARRPPPLRRAGARGGLPGRSATSSRSTPPRRWAATPSASGRARVPAAAWSAPPGGSCGPRSRRASTSSGTPPPRPAAAGGSSRSSPRRRCSSDRDGVERLVDRASVSSLSVTPAAAAFSCTCSGREAPMIAAATFVLPQHPRERELGHREARLVGDGPQALHGLEHRVVEQPADEAAHRLRASRASPPAAARPGGTCRSARPGRAATRRSARSRSRRTAG